MSTLGDRLRLARERKSLTQVAVRERTGINNKTLSGYEKGVSEPDIETLRKLAELYEVSIDWLSGGELSVLQKTRMGIGYKEQLAAEEDPWTVKERLIQYGAEPLLPSDMIQLPILGTIRAGEPILMNQNIEGYELVSKDITKGREAFILRVKGNSMSGDRIREGDLVICLVQEEVGPNDIAVVAIEGEEATLKRVKIQGQQCVLYSSNPDYEPMIYPAKDIHIIGIVKRVMFSL